MWAESTGNIAASTSSPARNGGPATPTLTQSGPTRQSNDTDAAWFDPDPKSKSGRSARVIGYSPTAGMVITVILVPKGEEEWWGANAWKDNDTDERIYREGRS